MKACAMMTALMPLAAAPGGELKLVVRGGEADLSHVPLRARVELSEDVAEAAPGQIAVTLRGPAGTEVPGQVLPGEDGLQLVWIAPSVPAGKKQQWTAVFSQAEKPSKGFSLHDTKGEHLDVRWNGQPVARYMYARDTSSAARAHATYKPYLHVFDPTGKGFITKGPGGLYTHHRGVFIGFSKLGYGDGRRNDWWHMKGVAQVHRKFTRRGAGAAAARFTSHVDWDGPQGEPAVRERRTTTFYRPPADAMLLMDVRSTLTAARSDIRLDGDPEHAGVQFRAHNDVKKEQTRYHFPEGVENVRKERDLPWAAMSFLVGDRRYTVQHVNHPDNPGGTIYSAYRDYGRFGAFFAADLEEGQSLTVRYRLLVSPGEAPPRARLQKRRRAFARPPAVSVAQ